MKVTIILVLSLIGSIVTAETWPNSVPFSGALCGVIAVLFLSREL